jgi:hypothetical protein
MERLFTAEEITTLEATSNRHRQAGFGVTPKIIVTTGLTALLIFVAATEYSVLSDIFNFTKGSSLPGEDQKWSTDLLAMTGVLTMVATHVYAIRHPHSLVTRLIDRLAGISLPIYGVGAGLAFASINWFDGIDAIASKATSGEMFSIPESSAVGLLMDRVVALFPLVFVIGLGSLALTNVMVSHAVIEKIISNARQIITRWRAAKEAASAIKIIRECERQYGELTQQRDALLDDERSHDVSVAHDIMATISTAVQPYEVWLTNQRLQGASPDKRLAVPQSNLDVKEMTKQVAALRAINVKTILSAIRSNA